MQYVLGGNVCKAPVREYGKIEVTVDKTSKLFSDVSEKTICWMSHNDYIERIAPGFRIVAYSGLSSGSSRVGGEEPVRDPVPSRGAAYPGRKQDAS